MEIIALVVPVVGLCQLAAATVMPRRTAICLTVAAEVRRAAVAVVVASSTVSPV
jgi:hypothetical protein